MNKLSRTFSCQFRKQYMRPIICDICMEPMELYAASVTDVDGGTTGMKYGGGNSGSARANENNDEWDFWGEED